MYPRICLAIDNCFASKRWTAPIDWATKVREIGLTYIEASADTECDALYTTAGYRRDWVEAVRKAQSRTGVRVANMYSGHGTYATLGLAHTDERIRERMQHDWLDTMAAVTAELGAGLGFFCHAFDERVLQDPEAYDSAKDDLYDRLGQVAQLCADLGIRYTGVEQMYTPHQIPWTMAGAEDLMREVHARSGSLFYTTLDVGHACGQRRFQRLDQAALRQALAKFRTQGAREGLWLGPESAYGIFSQAVADGHVHADAWIERIEGEMSCYPYLFASYEDGDPYGWLERLACYSPIIHLQQTPGDSSPHLPFTAGHNDHGIIERTRVLEAIARSYEREARAGLPPRCETLYLTIEVFPHLVQYPVDIIRQLQETVAYWREAVPEDGLTLDTLLARPGPGV